MSQMKIATWNLDLVCDYLTTNNIAICCLQETKIPMNFPEDVLNCNNYVIELKQNSLEKELAFLFVKMSNMYEEEILKK